MAFNAISPLNLRVDASNKEELLFLISVCSIDIAFKTELSSSNEMDNFDMINNALLSSLISDDKTVCPLNNQKPETPSLSTKVNAIVIVVAGICFENKNEGCALNVVPLCSQFYPASDLNSKIG